MGGLLVNDAFSEANWSKFNGEVVFVVASWLKEEGRSTVKPKIDNVYKTTNRM